MINFICRDGHTKFFYLEWREKKHYYYSVSSKNGVVLMKSKNFTNLRDAKRHFTALLGATWDSDG